MNNWKNICPLDAIPPLGARVVRNGDIDIAIFRGRDDHVFAVADRCPHKGGRLSQGIVFDNKVACPLHNWTICLDDGKAVAPDVGCTQTFNVKVEHGQVFLAAPNRSSSSNAAAEFFPPLKEAI
ncbi:MAG: nitrite reductase small subunit NirD [Burkholderiales bacterium]|nr:nitrite reductase small subunit NirD [Burkholderiales bacterium]